VIRFWFSRPSYVTQTEKPKPQEADYRRQVADALAALMVDVTPPKRIDGMEWPERDKDHPACTHMWSDNDAIALEALEQAHSNVIPMRATR
jgi:hypothetical protein